MEERSEMTQRILNITLEIIYLLTGEDYIIVKKPGGRTPHNNRLQVVEGFCRKQNSLSSVPPLHPPTPENNDEQKILELTNQITELLTGEVPIRCQDVTVYLSMEEWQYLEGHKEDYKEAMMEDPPSPPSPDGYEDGRISGESPFPHMSADLLVEDGIMTDSGAEPPDLSRVGTPTSSEGSFSIHIKEEPVSSEEDNLMDDNTTEPIEYNTLIIKEEPPPYEEMGGPNDDTYTPAEEMAETFSRIKVQNILPEEDCHPNTNIYPPADIKPEPTPCPRRTPRKLHRRSDHPPPPPPPPVPKKAPKVLAYEVEIPMDSTPAKGPENASLYSVRQKKDSMEILYHCPSCYKGFSSNLDLARHQVIHTVDKLFICSLCGKSFTEMSFLVKHQVIHTDLKLCVCPVCQGCFYSEASLARHQKTHALPSFCSTCGKCFFNKSELAVHERKHSGERPFGCHFCGKHFIAKSVLNKHMLIHTQIDGTK